LLQSIPLRRPTSFTYLHSPDPDQQGSDSSRESLYIRHRQVKRYFKISEDWQPRTQGDGMNVDATDAKTIPDILLAFFFALPVPVDCI
jgi:hypothetical protein